MKWFKKKKKPVVTDNKIETVDVIEPQINADNKNKKANLIRAGIATFLVFSGIFGIKEYNSKIHTIEFYEKEETVDIGSKLDFNYEINPKSAEYEAEDIQIVIENDDLLLKKNNDYIANKEGVVKAYVRYKDKNYDVKTFTLQPVLVNSIFVKDVNVGTNLSEKFEINILPKNATNKDVSISTDETEIIRIDNDTIYGLSEGTAVVKVSSQDGPKTTFNVTVKNVEPEKISFSTISEVYTVGDEDTLSVEFQPKIISNEHVYWSSSNSNVIRVSEDGSLVAVNPGVATITAAYSDDVMCSKEITVNYPPVQTIEVGTNYNRLYVGSSTRLWVTLTPEKVNDRSVTWNSSDENVIKVDANGLITALSVGSARIYATSSNDKYASVEIECIEAPKQTINVASVPSSTDSSNSISRSAPSSGGITYVLNIENHKFHRPTCGSLPTVNRQDTTASRDEVIGWGYVPCKKCNP